MITSYVSGNLIHYVDNQWKYEDGVSIDQEIRPCTRCGELPTEEGHDACLGHIDGVEHACCGHGIEKPYIIHERNE